jgi:formiminotetrahydrofolate cyclodeaminase
MSVRSGRSFGLPDELLAGIAAETRAPAGGSVAAIVVALAAALVAKAARLSRTSWRHAPGAVAQAEALRARVMPLAEADAAAYAEAIAALEARDPGLGEALSRAAQVPLVIAAAAADVASLAKSVAEEGDPNTRGDAAAAAVFAHAAAQAAAHLVEINLSATRDDERVLVARALAETAQRAADAALATGTA